MSQHHVRDTSWGVIDFDDRAGFVFVQQRWHYQWLLWPGVTQAWTLHEKQRFHSTVDLEIWDAWSYKIRLSVAGKSNIALRLLGRPIRMNFDVKWTVKPPWDWTVKAWKMPPGTAPTTLHVSKVIPMTKVIELDTADLRPRAAGNNAGAQTANFRTPPHEFGHGILGGNATANPDEYVQASPNLADSSSIMNIGRDLRRRHLTAVIAELNKMVPDLTFAIVAPVL